MERIWLKHYPPGVPADIDPTQYPSLVDLFEESFAKFRDRKAFICMDKAITYGELDEMSAAFGAYLQSKGLKKGARVAVMMPNVLQISGRHRRGAARRLYGGQRQPALHPARARTSAQGFRRRSHHRAGELRHDRRAGGREDPGQAHHRRHHGRPARLQGRDRQFRGSPRQEDGAGLLAAERGELQRRARRRPRHEADEAADRAGRRRLPAIHRRHHRRFQGRDAAPPQHRRQRAAERRLAAAGAGNAAEGSRAAVHRLRAAAVSHLRADRLLPARPCAPAASIC